MEPTKNGRKRLTTNTAAFAVGAFPSCITSRLNPGAGTGVIQSSLFLEILPPPLFPPCESKSCFIIPISQE